MTGNFCDHDWSKTTKTTVLLSKTIAELPSTFQDQLLQMAGMKERRLIYKYELDYLNYNGILSIDPTYV